MDQIAVFPDRTSISATLVPTFKAFVPLLLGNKDNILSIQPSTHAYGKHPRQKLDIYTSPTESSTSTKSPILIFLYGGGLTRGDKIIPMIPGSLVYNNLGTFFASRGYTTVIPDYRRVNDKKEGTGEDAVFPSGAEDVAAVFSWLEKSDFASRDKKVPRDVFVMGNSAGGVHLSSFMFNKDFLGDMKRLATDSTLRFAGAVLLSVPTDFDGAIEARIPTLETYWSESLTKSGDKPGVSVVEQFEPRGLLLSLEGQKEPQVPASFYIPPVLMAYGELDPDDEILGPRDRFVLAWKKVFGNEDGLENIVLERHNHISPPLGLMCGDESAEKWGLEICAFMKTHAN